MEEFAARLRALREGKRPVRSMTVTSQLMGLAPDALRRYERGLADPSVAALEKIADYYGVTTDYLLGREPRKKFSKFPSKGERKGKTVM